MPSKNQMEGLIAHRILLGEYESGELLKEEALASEFKVSRTPVREVLSTLVAKGYAEYEAQHGVTAPRTDMQTVGKLLEAMEMMIHWFLPLSAARMTTERVETLKDLVVRMQETSIDADVRNFVTAYWKWTKVLIKSADNEYLCMAYRRVAFHIHRIRAMAMKEWQKEQIAASMSATVNYASDMVKALAAHDRKQSARLGIETVQRLRNEIAMSQLGMGLRETGEMDFLSTQKV